MDPVDEVVNELVAAVGEPVDELLDEAVDALDESDFVKIDWPLQIAPGSKLIKVQRERLTQKENRSNFPGISTFITSIINGTSISHKPFR